MECEATFRKYLAEICDHAFPDAGYFKQLLGFIFQFQKLLWPPLDCFGGVAIGADTERVFAGYFEKIGRFVEDGR
jgi:hypothetical protein